MKCDVISRFQGKIYYHETEVNNLWKDDWPSNYKLIRVFARKYRLVQMYPSGLFFWQFNSDLSQVWKYRGYNLRPEYLKEAVGKGIKDGEKQFYIPIRECVLYNTCNDDILNYYKKEVKFRMVYD